MAKFTDLMELKNDTERKKVIRERTIAELTKTLTAMFGDDTICLPKKITVFNADIPKGTIICDVGDVLDSDKAIVGAIIEVSVKVKSWNTVATKKGTRYAVTMDDILLALENNEDS